jgi:hypothetical protein
MSSSRAVEHTVTNRGGNRFQLRLLPYRMTENKVDGAVITLADVSRQERSGASA